MIVEFYFVFLFYYKIFNKIFFLISCGVKLGLEDVIMWVGELFYIGYIKNVWMFLYFFSKYLLNSYYVLDIRLVLGDRKMCYILRY